MREPRLESFYSRLHDAASAYSCSPLLIFPSASDAYSLCALKIVAHVLSSDTIRYSVYPVSSFSDNESLAGVNLRSSDLPISLLLVNWGCHRDPWRFLNLGPKARVFVMDSHRPIHLHNLSEQNNRVVVLYTQEDEHQADLAYDFDVSALANASAPNSEDEFNENSDSDEHSDSENEEEENGGNRKRRRVSRGSEEDPVGLFLKLKAEYYKLGTFHGRPSGCLLLN